jgi:hypothetical protein
MLLGSVDIRLANIAGDCGSNDRGLDGARLLEEDDVEHLIDSNTIFLALRVPLISGSPV